MKLELEVRGGFTGPAGKQTVAVDLDQLPTAAATALRQQLESVPASSWGGSYLDPHPKPWQFQHQLRVSDGNEQRSAVFHLGHGPPALSAIAKQLLEREG
jgi:hypothetical protein